MATLYPPIIAAAQPAFIDVDNYNIQFTFPNLIRISDIGHIQIRLVYQSNNKTAVNTELYPDGIVYKKMTESIKKGVVAISHNDLADKKWNSDTYYKVQLRFGKATELWGDNSNFSAWKQQQIENNQTTQQTFGEWSTIMVLKCINKPTILFADQEVDGGGAQVEQVTQIDSSLTPLLIGKYFSTSYEPVDKFRFKIYTSSNDLLLDSGWQQHNASKDNNIKGNPVSSVDEFRCSTALDNNETYKVIYSVLTKNGYIGESSNSYLSIIQRDYSVLTNISLSIDDNSILTRENGYINIIISFDTFVSGQFVILRTDEYSDYNVWEEICCFTIFNQKLPIEKRDYSIESGIRYKYALAKQDAQGNRSAFLYELNQPIRSVDFEYSYLLGENHYLRLMFDNTVQSFKKNVFLNKLDTIGGKYATITKNGSSYYAEFQLEGLISVQTEEEVESWGEGKAARVSSANSPLADSQETINYLDDFNNLSHEQYFIERKYREDIIDFLNDGKYKLYKSPTEGNILVVLTNVILTPKQELGRLLYSFSATAYEVGEATLENLNEYNLINIVESDDDELDNLEAVHVGQVTGVFKDENIINTIQNQVNNLYEDMKLDRVVSIIIDRYPDLNYTALIEDYTGQLYELEAEYESSGNLTILNEIEAVKNKITELQEVKECVETAASDYIILSVNGNEVRIAPDRALILSDVDITDLKQVPHTIDNNSYYSPLVIYYTAIVSLDNIETQEYSTSIQKIENLTLWGRFNGIFEEDETIIRNYNSNYRNTGVFIYNESDNTTNRNYIVVQSKDILVAIQEKCKEKIEQKYNVKLTDYDMETKQWVSEDGKLTYNFGFLQSFAIEADENTTFYINNDQRVIIGETCTYQSNKFNNNTITSLVFDTDEQTYAIVDYYCKVYIEIRGE